MNWPQTLLAGLLALLALSLLVAGVSARRFDRRIQGFVDDLRADADSAGDPFRPAEVADAPAPVRRYLETVLEDGQPPVDTVAIEQSGEIRLGGPEGDWRAFTARQHCSREPPAFVWDAQIDVAPLLPARVLDCYVRGAGRLRARLRGAIPVASAGPDPEMDMGEVLRYLAESVWYPTSLIPSDRLEWVPIDDTSARATLSHGDRSASLVFEFDDEGLVERVSGERYRQEDGDYAMWVGYFRTYERRNGRLIPLEGDVAWALPDGESSYWRGTIDRIEHRDGTAGPP
jgi:hypothetical protein